MSETFNSLEVRYAGFVGTPTGRQLYELLELLTNEENLIIVTRKQLPKPLTRLVLGAGSKINVVSSNLIDQIDSLFVFKDPDIADLLEADSRKIPIYDSNVLCAA